MDIEISDRMKQLIFLIIAVSVVLVSVFHIDNFVFMILGAIGGYWVIPFIREKLGMLKR